MAVISVTELNDRSYASDYKLRRTAKRTFLVQFDDPVYEGLGAAVGVGIDYGDIYRTQFSATLGDFTYDSGCIATRFEASPEQPDNNLTLWRVTWHYESHLDEQGDPALWSTTQGAGGSTQGGGGLNERPELEPTKYFWGKMDRTRALPKPIESPSNSFNKFQNSAGTPFSKVPEVDNSALLLTIQKNLILPSPQDAFNEYRSYWDTVNADPFFGFLPGYVKCVSITGESAFRNDVVYYPITFVFAIDTTWGWLWHPVDKGPEYINEASGLRVKSIEETGHGSEVFLDGEGGKLGTTSAPVELDFTIYEEKEFWPLDLE
jgi:hypothetical protein